MRNRDRHVFTLTIVVLLLAFSCSPKKSIEEDFQQEMETLEKKTTPPEANVVTRSAPFRTDWSHTASWDIETTMGKTDYSNWVISQLKPEFKVERRDNSRVTFLKLEDNNTHSVDCRLSLAKDKLLVHIEFSASPD